MQCTQPVTNQYLGSALIFLQGDKEKERSLTDQMLKGSVRPFPGKAGGP